MGKKERKIRSKIHIILTEYQDGKITAEGALGDIRRFLFPITITDPLRPVDIWRLGTGGGEDDAFSLASIQDANM